MNPTGQEQFIQTWAPLFATILGLIPAYIAHRKGRSFGLWWIYGAMLFIIALFHSLMLKPALPPVSQTELPPPEPLPPPSPPGTKSCCFCGQLIDELSSKCPVCKKDQPYRA